MYQALACHAPQGGLKNATSVLALVTVVVTSSCGRAQHITRGLATQLPTKTNGATASPAFTQVPMVLVAHATPGGSTTTAATVNSIGTPELVRWLTEMIRANLPPTYEDDRKWNRQKEVWDGIKLRREGLRLETKRKKKMVNAGTWTKYRIAIVEPDKNLHIQFHRLDQLPDGRIAFSITVDSVLDVFGRLSQWVRDVQVISISANADATCRLALEGTVDFRMNLLKLPPDIVIRPHVDVAHVALVDYRVRRISQIGGKWAESLGKGLRRSVDDKIDDLNGKLVAKINKQLEKHSDRLAFSPQQWIRSKLPWPDDGSSDH